jgi:hypothetical protein
MIRRLVEANYLQSSDTPTPARVHFWLRQLRTPELLIEAAANHATVARELERERPLLTSALTRDSAAVADALAAEEARERDADRGYWRPLRAELEQMRRDER